MTNILFVCTQNVFRSFSAQKLLEKLLLDKKDKSITVDSCGTVAYHWERPYTYTVDRLQEYGITLKEMHKNKKMNQELIGWADIIICMTKSHKAIVEREFDITAYLFNEVAGIGETDVSDDNEVEVTTTLEKFAIDTVDYIKEKTPLIYKNLKKFA